MKERRPSPLDDRGEKTCTALEELPETRYRLEPSRKAPRHNWVLCQLSYTPIEEVMGVEPTTPSYITSYVSERLVLNLPSTCALWGSNP